MVYKISQIFLARALVTRQLAGGVRRGRWASLAQTRIVACTLGSLPFPVQANICRPVVVMVRHSRDGKRLPPGPTPFGTKFVRARRGKKQTERPVSPARTGDRNRVVWHVGEPLCHPWAPPTPPCWMDHGRGQRGGATSTPTAKPRLTVVLIRPNRTFWCTAVSFGSLGAPVTTGGATCHLPNISRNTSSTCKTAL